MADKIINDEIVKTSNAAPQLSVETLLKMLVDSQKQNAEANRQLADAMLESRKPYIDPKVLQQKQTELEEKAKAVAITLAQRQYLKTNCSHLREIDNTSNIKWMEHSNGIVKGVCGNCFSEFDTRNPADFALIRGDAKASRNMGRAGQHSKTRLIGHA